MENKILGIAKYAYTHVPFYKELYNDKRINPYNDIRINDLPIIKKEDIVRCPERLISDEYKIDDLLKSHTSGTTGLQLFSYNTKEEQLKRAMLIWSEREKNCHNIMRKKKAIFHDIRELENKPIQIINDMLYLSTMYLNIERFDQYYDALNEYQPKFIRCCPSAFYEFVRYMKQSSKKMKYKIDYIEMANEYLAPGVYKELKDFFEDSFIINVYGASEFYPIANACTNNKLHESKDAVFIEVLNNDGQGYGHLVITSLINRAMPFIRYDIGDIGKLTGETCSCGKDGRVLDLRSGRVYDYYMDGDRKITADYFRRMLTEYFHLKNNDNNFVQFSIQQKEKDLLRYSLLVKDEINIEDITFFLNERINKFLINPVTVEVDTRLNMLDKSRTSKFKMYDFMN